MSIRRTAPRVPNAARLKVSLKSRKTDSGDDINVDQVVAQAYTGGGLKYRRVTVDGVLAAARNNGCANQAEDILLEACGLKPVAEPAPAQPAAPLQAEAMDDAPPAGKGNAAGDDSPGEADEAPAGDPPPPAAPEQDDNQRAGEVMEA